MWSCFDSWNQCGQSDSVVWTEFWTCSTANNPLNDSSRWRTFQTHFQLRSPSTTDRWCRNAVVPCAGQKRESSECGQGAATQRMSSPRTLAVQRLGKVIGYLCSTGEQLFSRNRLLAMDVANQQMRRFESLSPSAMLTGVPTVLTGVQHQVESSYWMGILHLWKPLWLGWFPWHNEFIPRSWDMRPYNYSCISMCVYIYICTYIYIHYIALHYMCIYI